MLTDAGVLLWQGLTYPFHPSTGEPWTAQSVAAFIAANPSEPVEPVDPVAPYDHRRISKADFARLFTGAQEVQVNKWEKICKAVPPEEYDDPLNGLTLSVERVLKAFERPLEFIELNHPETRQGLEIMAYVGVFGDDHAIAAAEVERILRGELPS